MVLEKRKDYIRQFVAQGISLDKAYNLAYSTPEQIEEIKSDDEFLIEMCDMTLSLSLTYIQEYNDVTEQSKSPSDHLKRLTNVMPEVFKDTAEIEIGSITINKIKAD